MISKHSKRHPDVPIFESTRLDAIAAAGAVKTAAGARTALFVPELHRLFIAVPHRGEQPAAIRAFEVKPGG